MVIFSGTRQQWTCGKTTEACRQRPRGCQPMPQGEGVLSLHHNDVLGGPNKRRWGEIMAKDLEAVLRPAIPDLVLLLRVEGVGTGRSRVRDNRDCGGGSRMDGTGGLAMVLVAGQPASSALQDALQEDCRRVGDEVVLRVCHNHEVGGRLDVERRLAIVQQHEHVPSQRLWGCLLVHYSAPRFGTPSGSMWS